MGKFNRPAERHYQNDCNDENEIRHRCARRRRVAPGHIGKNGTGILLSENEKDWGLRQLPFFCVVFFSFVSLYQGGDSVDYSCRGGGQVGEESVEYNEKWLVGC